MCMGLFVCREGRGSGTKNRHKSGTWAKVQNADAIRHNYERNQIV